MGQDESTSSPAVTQSQDPEQIERGIEQTREQLGDTVEALTQKADLKAQARRKLEGAKATVASKKERLVTGARGASPDVVVSISSQASQKARENPMPLAAFGVFAAGFLVGRMFGR